MAGAIEIASLFATLDLRDNLTSGLQGASNQLSGFEQGMTRAGRSLQGAGMGLTAMTAPILAFGAAGIVAASNFEGVMTQLQIFGDLGPAEMRAVQDAALQMGADTMFSAQDAAGAMLELVKSGMDVETAMLSTRAALDLAAAGEMSVTEASGVVSDAMSIFGLNAEDTTSIIDAFANAALSSRADVRGLSQGMRNVGPVARRYGLSIEQTAAALAVMADNGIEGAESGTALRSMLMNMTRDVPEVQQACDDLGVSFYDTNGAVRDFDTVLDELGTALQDLPAEEQNRIMQTLAGTYGITGLSALLAAGGIDEMLVAMGNSPGASALAQAAMGTFAGKVDALKGSVETLMITALTPFLQTVLTPLAEKATEVVNAISDWVARNPELMAQLMPLIAGGLLLGPVLLAVGTAMTLAAPAV